MINPDQKIVERFHQIIDNIKLIECTNPSRPPDKEYWKLVEFMREHEENNRDFFTGLLWPLLGNKVNESIDMMEFLIHELKWEEIREKVINLRDNNQGDTPDQYNVRTRCFHFLEAFKEDWDGRDIYECWDPS